MKYHWVGLFAAALFVVLGGIWIDVPGIQNDEALFAAPLFEPREAHATVRILGVRFPSMLLSYLGTLKTALYSVVFAVWDPSPESIRGPALAIGALTIWLFYRLLLYAGRPRIAWMATFLLATDATFLFLTRCDWGPVALQHLLAVTVMFGALRYVQTGRRGWVALCGFAIGLGLWDKLTFAWLMAGMTLPGLLLFRREILGKVTRGGIAALVGSFVLGAYPFLAYNWKTGAESFRNASHFSVDILWYKLVLMWRTLGGYSLFSYVVGGDIPEYMKLTAPIQWLSVIALCAAPWLWRDRLYRFTILAFAVGYASMLFVDGAGGSAHHTGLLWPLPQVAAALVLAKLPRRVGAVCLAVCLTANLWMVERHYRNLDQFGAGDDGWSDGIYALSDALSKDDTPCYVADWGMYNALRLIGVGKLPLQMGVKNVDQAYYEKARVIAYVDGKGFFTKNLLELKREVRSHSLRLESERLIRDRQGRETYVIYRIIRK